MFDKKIIEEIKNIQVKPVDNKAFETKLKQASLKFSNNLRSFAKSETEETEILLSKAS